MFDRENLTGVFLLGICAIGGAVLVGAIVRGERLTWTGPSWLAILLTVLFFGAVVFGMVANFRKRSGGEGNAGGPAWPDPRTGRTGQPGGWRRWFRRDRTR
ncbi:MAG: hypothetical protein M3462_08910 [Chloroflexota bacterium]|nr:hypothetical protein [Chloroflexota bacterium]